MALAHLKNLLNRQKQDNAPNMTRAASGLNGIKIKKMPHIWKSKISWKVAATVFATVTLLQIVILYISTQNLHQQKLNELSERSRVAVASALNPNGNNMPFSDAAIQKLFSTTPIEGFTVYSSNFERIASRGIQTVLVPSTDTNSSTHHRSADKSAYERIYSPVQLNNAPYFIATRSNASAVKSDLAKHIFRSFVAILLVSTFVTIVLMLALGRWLIEPLLFLDSNLRRALSSPESPPSMSSHYNMRQDEIGSVISMTQRLIKQNSKNIREVKGRAEDQIHKMAYFDTLTGLPNKTNFLEKLTQFTQRTELSPYKQNIRYAVIAMDLDHFKDVNDSMGHNVGDAILKAVGQRLRSSLPETSVVARNGEDEFAVAMPLVGNMKTASQVGEKVQSIIRSMPITVFNENFQVRASLGVSTFPDDSDDPAQVLKNADVALNRAKEDGRDQMLEYSKDFDRVVQERFQMLRDLRNAMDNQELLLHFQPQFDLKSGRIIGAEALLRWFTDDGRFVSPADFIPIAEQSGLIVPIGEMVMRESFRVAKLCEDSGKDIRIAINVSGAQFHQSDLVSFTAELLKETGVAPHHIELEVTESVFMDDLNHAVDILQKLHALGVELAIDDFGTGYSSLSYLRQFPIDRLKIDQSFIRDALNDPNDASITKTIIALGSALGLKVIAEGVETKDHELFLLEQNCDEVQGFRYSRPVPEDKFFEFVNRYTGSFEYFDTQESKSA